MTATTATTGSKFHTSHPQNNNYDENGDANTFQSLHVTLALKFLTELTLSFTETDAANLVFEFKEPVAQFIFGQKTNSDIVKFRAADETDNLAKIFVNLFELTVDGVLWAANMDESKLEIDASKIWLDLEYFAILSHFQKRSDVLVLEQLLNAQFDYSMGASSQSSPPPKLHSTDTSGFKHQQFNLISTVNNFFSFGGRGQLRKTLKFYTQSMKDAQGVGMFFTLPTCLFDGVKFVSRHFEAFLVARFLIDNLTTSSTASSLASTRNCNPMVYFIMDQIFSQDDELETVRKIFTFLLVRGHQTKCETFKLICNQFKTTFYILHPQIPTIHSNLLNLLKQIYQFD